MTPPTSNTTMRGPALREPRRSSPGLTGPGVVTLMTLTAAPQASAAQPSLYAKARLLGTRAEVRGSRRWALATGNRALRTRDQQSRKRALELRHGAQLTNAGPRSILIYPRPGSA